MTDQITVQGGKISISTHHLAPRRATSWLRSLNLQAWSADHRQALPWRRSIARQITDLDRQRQTCQLSTCSRWKRHDFPISMRKVCPKAGVLSQRNSLLTWLTKPGQETKEWRRIQYYMHYADESLMHLVETWFLASCEHDFSFLTALPMSSSLCVHLAYRHFLRAA